MRVGFNTGRFCFTAASRIVRLATLLSLCAAPVTAESFAESSPVEDSFYEIIYADANIGASSGGHCALKFRNTVYHYQMFPDGIFRLVRDEWPDFRRLYNDFENRTLGIRRVPLPPARLRKLQDYFALRFVVQLRHLDTYTALRGEAGVLESLTESSGPGRLPHVTLPGYGLFQDPSITAGDSTAATDRDGADELRTQVARLLGEDLDAYLSTRRDQLIDRVRSNLERAMRIGALSTPDGDRADFALPAQIDADRLPPAPDFFSQSLLEDLQELAALRVLDLAAPLADDALFDPYALDPPATSALNARERQALLIFRDNLITETVVLLRRAQPTPDRGAALLLNQARHRAITLSLHHNRLLTLDPFPVARVRVTAAAVEHDRPTVFRLAAQARAVSYQTRRSVFARNEPLSEARYNRLESDGGRYFEIARGARESGRTIRAARSPMIPGPGLPAPFALPAAALPDGWSRFVDRDAARAITTTRATEARYLGLLQRSYDYQLIRKNCVTELLRTIAAGDGLPDGRRFDETFRFIPFVAFNLFATNDTSTDANLTWLPSYRKRRVARMLEREGLIAQPRESFAHNSTVYLPRRVDSAFLLFTDDVFWIRPIFGLVNLTYALGYTTVGAATAPFDHGTRLDAGLRGALFSLPELAWFNIRKGSYEYLEPGPAP